MNKVLFSWIVCVLALVALLAWTGSSLVGTPPDTGERGLLSAHYSLQSVKGKVTEKDFAGKYQLIFFGFTRCPDLCPTTMAKIQTALSELGSHAEKITPIFISIDPEYDTPKIVASYASHFGKTVVGLTGTPEQVKAAEDNFKVFANKVEDANAQHGYTMDHSGFLYLIGPDGTYITHFSADIAQPTLRDELRRFVK